MGALEPMWVIRSCLEQYIDSLILSLGPILMGTIFNVLLHGIMILQCYVYFQRYKQYVKAPLTRVRLPDFNLGIGRG